MDQVTLTFNVEDFYLIINSMRDSCGCEACFRVTNNMMEQRKAQYQEGRLV